ncbi:unnamed protein product [Peniophora sp. CBMAI 1063]|nr:unnamed protein product [Peniophora sp. CBMAI 1063]
MPEQRMLTFSVALALDFGEFVISINGPDDMLFTVDWIPHVKSEAMDMSRSSVTNMLEAWPSYMQNVVKWLEHVYPAMTPEQKDMDISSFMSQNSDEQHLFAGIKQHSRSEVLYRAGLSPELTLREVVEARSRLYRLILGAWQYKYLVLHHTWPTFIKPTVYHRAIAPLFHQRLKYTDSSLHAHGKSPITLSTRLAEQLQKINDESEELASDGRRLSFDAFEPSLLEDALKHAPEFCPAIFGQSFWNSHKGEIDKLPWDGNPLVEKDTREGSFLSSVNLICTESWTRLLLPQKYRRSRAVKAYVYAQGTPNEIWTPIKPWRTPNTEVITSPQSHGDISSTQDIYMPGVLESPGVAVAVRSKSGKSRFTYPSRGVATDDSPATYQMMHVNLVKTLARITENKNHIARRGTIAMSEEEKAQRARAYKAFDEMWLDRFGYVPTSTKSSTGTEGTTKQESGLKRPRKRRQVDLVLADVQEEDKPQARKRARVENGISMRVDKEKEWWEEPYYG